MAFFGWAGSSPDWRWQGIIDRWGYIDRSGNVVISHMLKAGWPFREGLALVGDGGPI